MGGEWFGRMVLEFRETGVTGSLSSIEESGMAEVEVRLQLRV
jgi:hypothetical protein